MKFSFVFLLLALSNCARGATSTAWELSGYSDFLKGRMTGVSLSQDGTLQPGPGTRFNASLGQPALWGIAAGKNGVVYAATGHGGKLIQINGDGSRKDLWTAPQPEIFALCVDSHGTLYAGTSPNGGLFRISENGSAVEVWHSSEKYIWSISASADGTLLLGTGERGRVYRVNPAGQADLYYETNQSNVTALALAAGGTLYAGTEPNGLLFSIDGQGKGAVLLDSTLPEIRAIAVDQDGTVYAAAMGGAVASRTGTPSPSGIGTATTPVAAAAPTVITVSEAKENPLGAVDEQGNTLNVPSEIGRSASTNTSGNTGSATNTAVVEVTGVEKSTIYKVGPNHSVEVLRSSKEDNVYDLLLDGNSLLVGTDVRGRVYRLVGRRSTLVAELGDGVATRLLRNADTTYIALSNPGRLVALDPVGSEPGQFESPVHDSTAVARWGHLQYHGTGSGLSFRTRSGFSARPDSTWSSWSEPFPANQSRLIPSPPARFIQWRAEWAVGSSAQVNTVDIPYLPRNGPPAIHSITVSSIVGTNPAKSGTAAATAASANTAYSITVTDTGEAPAASTANSTSQTVSHLQATQTQISWQADDPDSDKLAYSVYFRAEEGATWQLVRSRMFENTLLLDPDVFADGRYFFRVVASDSPANSAEFAQESEMVSTPVLIDNTPPEVQIGTPNRSGSNLDLDISASDKTSSLRLCEVSLDAGSWHPLEAVDGVTDSPQEKFHVHLEGLKPGEHLVVVRLYDSANNAGLGRLVLR